MITERLKMDFTREDEIEELLKIALSWEDKDTTDGDAFTRDYFIKALNREDLPPIEDANPENFSIMSIRDKESGALLGFMDTYKGYPNPKTLWMGMFVIDKSQRRHGYGKEVIECVASNAKKSGLEAMGVGVSLKNWNGLKFWHKVGFDTIFNIVGPSDFIHDETAHIGLYKKI